MFQPAELQMTDSFQKETKNKPVSVNCGAVLHTTTGGKLIKTDCPSRLCGKF